MFEKEAEEYLKKDGTKAEQILSLMQGKIKVTIKQIPFILAAFQLTFKDGAEFGYNKANEWHYPSKGEYPKEYKDILICFLIENDMKDCVRGWYEYDLDENEHYFKTINIFGTGIIKKVYAWKDIVLPKESK